MGHDDARCFLLGGGKGAIVLQALGMSHHHGKRGTHVVGNAGDPVLAGGFLILEGAGNLVDAGADGAQNAAEANLHGLSLGQIVEGVKRWAEGLHHAALRDRVQQEDDGEVDQEEHQHVQGNAVERFLLNGKPERGVLVVRIAEHNEVRAFCPDERSCAFEFAIVRHHGNLILRERRGEPGGHMVRPCHRSVGVQHGAPAPCCVKVLLDALFRGGFAIGNAPGAVFVLGEAFRKVGNAHVAVLGIVAIPGVVVHQLGG